MSQVIDDRIIELALRSEDFIQALSEAQTALNDFDETVENISDDNAFGQVGDTVDEVSDKFGIFETVVRTVMFRATNNVLDFAEKAGKALTVFTSGNISAGYEKYERLVKSTQTMMNATGDSIEEVEAQMKKLMWYTDETSYNMADMVDNAAKLANSGMGMEESMDMMIGMANLAGEVGIDAQTLSRSLFQMTQAAGQGYLQYKDWKEAFGTKNVYNAEFKQALIDTAKEMYGEGFNFDIDSGFTTEALNKSQWLTMDVLNETLKRYSQYTNELYEIYKENDFSGSMSQLRAAYEEKYDKLLPDLLRAYEEDDYAYGQHFMEMTAQMGINFQTAKDIIEKGISGDVNAAAEQLASDVDNLINTYDDDVEKIVNAAVGMGYDMNDVVTYLDQGLDALKVRTTSLGEEALDASEVTKTWSEVVDSVKDAASTKWADIFTNIIGNFEQAKEIMTEINEWLWAIYVAPVDFLGSALETFQALEGYEELISGIHIAMDSIYNWNFDEEGGIYGWGNLLIDTLHDILVGVTGFEDPVMYVGQLIYKLAAAFNEFTQSLIPTDEQLEMFQILIYNVYGTLSGLGTILEALIVSGLRIINAILPDSYELMDILNLIFGTTSDLLVSADSIADIIAVVTDVIVDAINVVKSAIWFVLNIIMDIVPTLSVVAGGIISVLSTVVQYIVNVIYSTIYNSQESWDWFLSKIEEFRNRFMSVGDYIRGIKDSFANVMLYLAGPIEIFNNLVQLGKDILNTLYITIQRLLEALQRMNFFKALYEIIQLGALAGISRIIWSIGDAIRNLIRGTGGIAGFFKGLRDTFDDIGDSVSHFFNTLTASFNKEILTEIGKTLLMIAAAALLLSTIPIEQFNDISGAIVIMIAEMIIAISELGNTNNNLSYFQIQALADTFVKIGSAILLIGIALAGIAYMRSILTDEQFKEVSDLIVIMVGIMTALIGFITFVNRNKPAGKVVDPKKDPTITQYIGMAIFVKALSDAIFKLITSMAIVAYFVPADEIWTYAGVIIAIMAALGAFLFFMIRELRLLSENAFTISSNGPVEAKPIWQAFASLAVLIQSIASAVVMMLVPIALLRVLTNLLPAKENEMDPLWESVLVILAMLSMMWAFMSGLIAVANSFNQNNPDGVAKQLLAMGASMLMVAIAINMIILPLTLIMVALKGLEILTNGAIDDKVMLGVLGTLFGVLFVIALFFTAMTIIFDEFESTHTDMGKKMIQIATAVVILAVGLDLIMGGLIALAAATALFKGNVGWAVLELIGILTALGIFVFAISTIFQMPKNLLEIAASMIIIAIAVDMIANVIISLSKIDPAAAAVGVSQVFGILAAITLMMMGMKTVGLTKEDAIAYSASAFIIARALNTLAGVLILLGSINVEQLKVGAQALIQLMIVFSLFGLAMAGLSLLIGPEGALPFLAIAGGMLAIAAATWIMVDALSRSIDLFYKFRDFLLDPNLESDITMMFGRIGELLPILIEGLFDIALKVFQYCCENFIRHLDMIVKVLVALTTLLASVLGPILQPLLDALIDFLAMALVEIGLWMWEKLKWAWEKFSEWFKKTGFYTGITGYFTYLENRCIKFYNKIKNFFTKIGEALTAAWNFISGVFNRAIENVKNTIKNITTKVKTFFKKWYDFFYGAGQELYRRLSAFGARIGNFVMGIVNFFSNIGLYFLEGWKEIIDGIKEKLEPFTTFMSACCQGFVDGVNDVKDHWIKGVEAIRDIVSPIIDNIKEKWESFNTRMTEIWDSIKSGFEDFGDKWKKGMDEIKDWFGITPEEASNSGQEAGSNYAEGIANGIENSTDKVTEAATNSASDTKQATMNELHENSPSKDGEQYGEWYGEGMANGIIKSKDGVKEAGIQLSGTAKDQYTKSGIASGNAFNEALNNAISNNTVGDMLNADDNTILGKIRKGISDFLKESFDVDLSSITSKAEGLNLSEFIANLFPNLGEVDESKKKLSSWLNFDNIDVDWDTWLDNMSNMGTENGGIFSGVADLFNGENNYQDQIDEAANNFGAGLAEQTGSGYYDQTNDLLGDYYSSGYDSGSAFGEGYTDGYEDMYGAVGQEIQNGNYTYGVDANVSTDINSTVQETNRLLSQTNQLLGGNTEAITGQTQASEEATDESKSETKSKKSAEGKSEKQSEKNIKMLKATDSNVVKAAKTIVNLTDTMNQSGNFVENVGDMIVDSLSEYYSKDNSDSETPISKRPAGYSDNPEMNKPKVEDKSDEKKFNKIYNNIKETVSEFKIGKNTTKNIMSGLKGVSKIFKDYVVKGKITDPMMKALSSTFKSIDIDPETKELIANNTESEVEAIYINEVAMKKLTKTVGGVGTQFSTILNKNAQEMATNTTATNNNTAATIQSTTSSNTSTDANTEAVNTNTETTEEIYNSDSNTPLSKRPQGYSDNPEMNNPVEIVDGNTYGYSTAANAKDAAQASEDISQEVKYLKLIYKNNKEQLSVIRTQLENMWMLMPEIHNANVLMSDKVNAYMQPIADRLENIRVDTHSEMTTINNAYNNGMGVYIDGKALVGKIAKDMDIALGKMTVSKSR